MFASNYFRYYFLFFLLTGVFSAIGQNEVLVTPVISPPYSPYLADYQNQTIIILQNTTADQLSIKLTGRIEGDNGYLIFTKPEYFPSTPILLAPFEIRTLIVATDASDFLDFDNLETNVPGSVQRNIITTGMLPEGNYSFCVEAREFIGTRLLSASAPAGCVPVFISYPDPPAIISPECSASLENNLPVISWTPPIGNTQDALIVYDLYVVPLQENENPFEAMDRAYSYLAGNPIIFRDIQEPVYVWQPYDIPLEQGRTYAVQVVARDLLERGIFNNNGRSPVCTFRLEEGLTLGESGNELESINNFNFPTSSISGQLLYRFPGRGQEVSSSDQSLQITNTQIVDINQDVLNQAMDYKQPIIINPYPVNPNNAIPLANKTIKLVRDIIYELPHKAGEAPEFISPRYGNIAGGAVPAHPLNPLLLSSDGFGVGQVLAVTQTDEQGNYNFNYIQVDSLLDIGFYTEGLGTAYSGGDNSGVIDATAGGQIIINDVSYNSFEYIGCYEVLRIIVESPYYCSPDLAVIIQPNQDLQLPPLVSLVKAYNLNVTTKSSSDQIQQATAGSILKGIKVEVLRGLNDPVIYDVPENEGQNLGETEIIPPGFSFRILSSGETGQQGNVLFQNLVKHPISTSGKYLLRASSKASNTPYSYVTTVNSYPEGNGIEYSNQPNTTPYVHGNGLMPMDPILGFNNMHIFNSEYEVPTFNTEIIMEPDHPVVFGRVKHGVIGLPDVVIELRKNGQLIKSELSGPDGYFEFNPLESGHGYQLFCYRYGYAETIHPPDPFSLEMGTFKDFQEIQMVPLASVFGYVVNESGEPVLADVRIEDSPWYPTELVNSTSGFPTHNEPPLPETTGMSNIELEVLPQKSVFHFPSQSGKALMLIIDPYSDQYFRDTFLVTIPASGSQAHYLGVFTVPEKLHRPRFIVTNENGSPVHSAKIHVQENILTSNRAGIASTTFASPGLEFLVRIDPPDGSNLVPYQESLQIPISKKPIDIPITLLQGASISGLVTAGPDSLPLAGARVFLDDYQVWEYGLPLIETFTDENGNYTLNGVPEEFVYTAGGQAVPLSLKIRATKSDPNTAYFGDAKDIILPVNAPVYLHLEILEGADLTHIWELPVEIESATNLGGNTYRLSGAFVSIPDNPNFQLVLTETRLDFQEVQVVLIPGPTGKLIPDPIQSSIELDALSIPVGIMHAFQGKLTPVSAPGTSGQNSTNSVLIVREESPGKGLIEGKVSMDLASFAFSYNYTGKLHLGNTPDDIKLAVFRPTSVPYPQRAFSVMSYASVRGNGPVIADPTFKVHEFSASADRYQSYVFQDTVALFTVLHTNIPLASPSDLEIQAGYINILPDNILPFQQGDALTFSLETWEFQASSSWYYDNNNGGIHIPTVTIKTGSLDVPVKNLIIRYDDIDVGQLNINKRTGTGLSIAGVAELEITGQDPVFYLDPKVPTDLMPHWRIEILSDGNTPAAKTNIPEFQPGQITFNSFSLISNGEQYLDIDEQTVWIYEVLEFQLHGIQTSLNYFTLTGEADLHIPDVPGTSGVLSFSKPANNIVMQMDHLNVNLDGIGKVEFISANYVGAQHFTQGKFTAAGTIRAYDDQQNSIELKAQLLRTPNACRIEVIQVNNQNQKIVCGSQGTNYLEVLDGQMPANLTANNWETFYFNALPRSSKGLKADTEIIRFEVVGDIEASGAAISVTDMNTPFGNLKIIFDLADLSLSAFLHVTQDIPMGVVTIQEADLNFLMAEKGFYFMLAAKGDVPVAGVIDIISLAGHYSEFTPYMLQVWNEYTYQAVPESFQNGFSGFLINGKWTPVDASTGFDVIPEVIYLDFSASIIVEIRIAADFAEDSYEFSVLGAGEFLLLFGGPCFDTGVGVLVEVLVGAKVQNSNFDIYGCASVNLLGYYQVCAPFGIPPVCLDWCSSDCWSGGVRVDLTIGESVGGIEMDVDINGPSCSGNPMQIETAVQDLGIDCD